MSKNSLPNDSLQSLILYLGDEINRTNSSIEQYSDGNAMLDADGITREMGVSDIERLYGSNYDNSLAGDQGDNSVSGVTAWIGKDSAACPPVIRCRRVATDPG